MSALACALAAIIATACVEGSSVAPQDVTYSAMLLGRNAKPKSNTSSATGTATLAIVGGTATYTVAASGFATALVAGHIHIGGGDASGPVLVPFTIVAQSGTVASGAIQVTLPITQGNITISGDSLRALLEGGQLYVDLHTAAYPDGEIRGQLIRR